MANSIEFLLKVDDHATPAIHQFDNEIEKTLRNASAAHKAFAEGARSNMESYASGIKGVLERVNQSIMKSISSLKRSNNALPSFPFTIVPPELIIEYLELNLWSSKNIASIIKTIELLSQIKRFKTKFPRDPKRSKKDPRTPIEDMIGIAEKGVDIAQETRKLGKTGFVQQSQNQQLNVQIGQILEFLKKEEISNQTRNLRLEYIDVSLDKLVRCFCFEKEIEASEPVPVSGRGRLNGGPSTDGLKMDHNGPISSLGLPHSPTLVSFPGPVKPLASLQEDGLRAWMGYTDSVGNLIRRSSEAYQRDFAAPFIDATEETLGAALLGYEEQQAAGEDAYGALERFYERSAGEAIPEIARQSAAEQRSALQDLGVSSQALFGGISAGAQRAYLDMSSFGLNASQATTATFGALRGGLQEGFFDFLTGRLDNIGASFENMGLRMVNVWADVVAQMVTSWAASGLATLFNTPVGIPGLGFGGVGGGGGGGFSLPSIPGTGNLFGGGAGAAAGVSIFAPPSLTGVSASSGFFGQGGFLGTGSSFGQLTGGAGLGFGAGQLLSGLTGTSGTASTIGSGVGAIGGAIAGSLIPGVGTVLGGLIGGGAGGPLSGFLGGLIGGGKRGTFLSDRLEDVARDKADAFFRAIGAFDERETAIHARRIHNAVGNAGEGNQADYIARESKKDAQGLARIFQQATYNALLYKGRDYADRYAPHIPFLLAARGFNGIVNRATGFVAGEAGPERVRVEPLGPRSRGLRGEEPPRGDTITNHIHVNVDMSRSVLSSEHEMKRFARKIEAEIRKLQRRRYGNVPLHRMGRA